MRRPSALLLASIALGAACAAPARRVSFREAGLDAGSLPGDPPGERPAAPSPAPEPKVLLAAPDDGPEAPATGPAAPAAPIDGVLLRFAAEARDRRFEPAGRGGFPADRVEAWEALAAALDAWLRHGLPETPLPELVRARVTLDAELDLDRRRFGAPPPELAALLDDRARRLSRRAEAARALGQTLFTVTRPPALRWPIADAGLSSTYGARLHPLDHVRRMHFGIDLAAEPGRVVGAAGPGFVVRAGYAYGYGLVVDVRHPGELTSRYGHLGALLCSPGDRVETGQPLGVVGTTGRVTGPHLHFEVWRGGRPEDPLALLGARWAGAAVR